MMADYELFDHTADVGVRVRGSSLEEVFEGAARALFEIQVDLSDVQAVEKRQVSVEAGDLEQALVRWLQRLLYILDVDGLVLSRFAVEEVTETRVKGSVWGEELDEGRHTLKGAIKAVTYHGLEIEETEEGWRAQVLFDV